jgi:hypothetical protein
MYEHFKEAEPGAIGSIFIPKSAETVGKVYGRTREALIGWADGVPGLNLVGKAVRAII